MRTNQLFDHEKLEVYQASLAFVAWLEPMLVGLIRANPDYRLHEGDQD